jgi:hypothetical protein
MIKKLSAPIGFAMVGGTLLFAVACGDDEAPPVTNKGKGGSTATGGAAGAMSGGTAGTAGASTGGTPTGGAGGTPTTGGAGGTPMTGGATGGGAGGAGGATGGGAGGAGGATGGGAGGAGGMMCLSPLPRGGMGGMAGAGGMAAGAGGMAAGAGGAGGAGGAAAGAGGAGGAGGAAAGAGGAGGAPMTGPRVISTFDTPGSLMIMGLGNWGVGSYMMVPDSVASRNMTEGVSCAGSAQLTTPFTAYGQQSSIEINFSPLQNWTGFRKVHAKVKVLMPSTGNLNHLNIGSGIQLAANSTTMYNTFQGHQYPASTFADFGWHDVDLDVPGTIGTPLVMTEVIQVSVQVLTSAMAPATGPAAPVTTTILVDDVWVE